MTVSEIAIAFGVTPRALRFYESKGLLSPMRESSRRIYLEEDQRRLTMILKGRKLGFVLSGITLMARANDDLGLAQTLKLTREQCAEQIVQLETGFWVASTRDRDAGTTKTHRPVTSPNAFEFCNTIAG